jgi:hypothetical protein
MFVEGECKREALVLKPVNRLWGDLEGNGKQNLLIDRCR